jgi:hypothetical protein
MPVSDPSAPADGLDRPNASVPAVVVLVDGSAALSAAGKVAMSELPGLA